MPPLWQGMEDTPLQVQKGGDKHPAGHQEDWGQLQYPRGAAWPLSSTVAKGAAGESDESIVW